MVVLDQFAERLGVVRQRQPLRRILAPDVPADVVLCTRAMVDPTRLGTVSLEERAQPVAMPQGSSTSYARSCPFVLVATGP